MYDSYSSKTMFHIAIVAVASLLLFFSSGHENYRRLLHEMKIIPKDINGIQEQLKDESHMNPQSKAEFDKLLTRTESFIPNFDLDQFKLQSKRIETIKEMYERKKKNDITDVKEDNLKEKNILRQQPAVPMNKKAMNRAFALMTQFVYAARYKLEYGQLLRKQYNTALEYKIGYCFALMRDLRKQQMFLYTTMHYNYRAAILEEYPPVHWSWAEKKYVITFTTYSYSDFPSFLQMYEKIVRLNVDMLDIVALVQVLINQRMAVKEAEKANKTAHG